MPPKAQKQTMASAPMTTRWRTWAMATAITKASATTTDTDPESTLEKRSTAISTPPTTATTMAKSGATLTVHRPTAALAITTKNTEIDLYS